jgi:ABC-type transporter Mla maintaining outer membrane lipid asymmetry permease subunit MlaE
MEGHDMKKFAFSSLAIGLLVAASSGAGLAAQDSDALSAAQRKIQTLAFVARRDCAPAIGPQLVSVSSGGASMTSELCIPR